MAPECAHWVRLCSQSGERLMYQKHALVAPVEQDWLSAEVRMRAQVLRRGGVSFAHGRLVETCAQLGRTEIHHV
jgi:hypothetical protein